MSDEMPSKRSLREEQLFNPLRGPTWRFERVLELVTHEPRALRCKSFDDGYVRTMREFMLAYNPRNKTTRTRLFIDYPGPYHALAIHQSPDPEIRLNIQCRILASQSDEQIAQRIGSTPEAICWYETVFYSVRERLENRDWITRHVLGDPAYRNVTNTELPMKLLAYGLGPVIVDFLFSSAFAGEHPADPQEAKRAMIDFAFSAVLRRTAMAINTVEINKFNVVPLMEVLRQYVADSRAAEDSTTANDGLIACIAETIKGIRILKGDKAVEVLGKTSPNLLKYDSGAVELRDHELYQAIGGRNLPELDRLMALTMPPPGPRGEENGHPVESRQQGQQ